MKNTVMWVIVFFILVLRRKWNFICLKICVKFLSMFHWRSLRHVVICTTVCWMWSAKSRIRTTWIFNYLWRNLRTHRSKIFCWI